MGLTLQALVTSTLCIASAGDYDRLRLFGRLRSRGLHVDVSYVTFGASFRSGQVSLYENVLIRLQLQSRVIIIMKRNQVSTTYQ